MVTFDVHKLPSYKLSVRTSNNERKNCRKKECFSVEACYDQREPRAWCILNKNQSWTRRGCFCDSKLHSCVIERKNSGRLEYSYCLPKEEWKCSYNDGRAQGRDGGKRDGNRCRGF
ncbi:hypothetical protein WUBG_17966 [Wuchereria bancrofti]|uniref:Uncharacterized protein n=1 Tax=Wuchereria bancrofti TaxID=6293 RepID=J9DND0_WUCBA|nr:hypothetical protein WUBG_17966 [Wuchereria bancrofti]